MALRNSKPDRIVFHALPRIEGDAPPTPKAIADAAKFLADKGFKVLDPTAVILTAVGRAGLLEKAFGLQLEHLPADTVNGVWYPSDEMPSVPTKETAGELAKDRGPVVGLSFPVLPLFLADRSGGGRPPRPPEDLGTTVRRLLQLNALHGRGVRGKGVRIALLDTGFFLRHGWFSDHRLTAKVVRSSGDTTGLGNPLADAYGHGTAMLAILLSVAPEAEVTGIKVDGSEANPYGDMVSGLNAALRLKPHVIVVPQHLSRLTDPLDPTDLVQQGSARAFEVLATFIRAAGITMIFAAGNMHTPPTPTAGEKTISASFDAIISAGGAKVNDDGTAAVSDLTVYFPSEQYPDTPLNSYVPDIALPVGRDAHDRIFRVPVTEDSNTFRAVQYPGDDGDFYADTAGWSSAATAMLGGVAALVLQNNPGLDPAQLRQRLRTARDTTVVGDKASPLGIPNHKLRTGHGVIDVSAAVGP